MSCDYEIGLYFGGEIAASSHFYLNVLNGHTGRFVSSFHSANPPISPLRPLVKRIFSLVV